MIKKIFILATLLIGLNGCASIDFYEVNGDGTMTEEGFLYYPPKPYLLVEKKDDNITSRIITLPDLAKPHRVKQNNGWGTADLGFEIENGMIKSFNSKTDSKGPETLTALTSMGTAKAAIDTAGAAILTAELSANKTMSMMGTSGKAEIISIVYKVKVFEESYNLLNNKVIPPLNADAKTFKTEIETLKNVLNTLQTNINIDYQPLDPDALLLSVEKRRKLAKKLTTQLKNVSSTLSFYAENKVEKPILALPAKISNTSLSDVIKKLIAFSLRSSSVTGLYEIDYINGQLNLHKVNFD